MMEAIARQIATHKQSSTTEIPRAFRALLTDNRVTGRDDDRAMPALSTARFYNLANEPFATGNRNRLGSTVGTQLATDPAQVRTHSAI